ncbi:hypothetical protein Ddye_002151 [Dipteronia dyeriana]|uniref:RNase H type-1 domain-containing protein n=1 Tax=Dipteronia dyeriana TaxID=168575 RepID=A0AAD9XQD5_9ROSI|nr:hypothetical protein Ddye_002151 [Dipteronia dyeriana]
MSCPRCEAGIEDTDHLLRGCKFSAGIWVTVLRDINLTVSLKERFEGWLYGLNMVWNDGFKYVVAETDSDCVAQLFNTETSPNHPLLSLIRSFREIINRDWRCVVQHIYREINSLVDGLAHLGHKVLRQATCCDKIHFLF